MVSIRPGASKPPIFCVHASAGDLRLFHNLARHLDPERPVYGLRAIMRDRELGLPFVSFEEMAQRYVGELRAVQPNGPYILAGECTGGQLAYELAQQLRAGGDEVAALVLIDSYGPRGLKLRRFVPRRAYRLVDIIRMLGFHLRTVATIEPEARNEYVWSRVKRVRGMVATRAAVWRGQPVEEVIRRSGFERALGAYRPSAYVGRVVLLCGGSLQWGIEPIPALGWGEFAANIEVSESPCYFGTCLLEPVVHTLAGQVDRLLDGLSPAHRPARSSGP